MKVYSSIGYGESVLSSLVFFDKRWNADLVAGAAENTKWE